jgi:hypothetical protein
MSEKSRNGELGWRSWEKTTATEQYELFLSANTELIKRDAE